MLALTRKVRERIVLKTSDGDVVIEVVKINGNRVKIGIEAPKSVAILRSELETKGESK